jgi:predicted GNAT family acetyltransferase
MAELRIIDNVDASRFEGWLGDTLAGRVEYRRDPDDNYVLIHTEVDDGFEGQGLGGRLAQGVLDDVRGRGLTVRVECPFIRGWIDRHPEYQPLVVEP